MSLSQLGLALTLIVWAAETFGWVTWSARVVAILALVTGILIVLENLVALPAVPRPVVRRRSAE